MVPEESQEMTSLNPAFSSREHITFSAAGERQMFPQQTKRMELMGVGILAGMKEE